MGVQENTFFKKIEVIFERTMTEIFPKLMLDTKPHIQEA